MPVPISIADLAPNPADNYPVGTEPVFPNLDNYIRAHAAFIAQLNARMDAEGLPLAAVMWWGGSRPLISKNSLPLDGQVKNRADYPALWAFVSTGGYPMVSEADWKATPMLRASFSSGDGSTTFRMPDLNGKEANSIGAVTVRGDGAQSAGASGKMQDSQNLAHKHGATVSTAGGHAHSFSGSTANAGEHSHTINASNWGSYGSGTHAGNGASGPVTVTSAAGAHSHGFSGTTAEGGAHTHTVSMDDAGGTEARMKSATGAWVMRVK